jgi:hypothetical protein
LPINKAAVGNRSRRYNIAAMDMLTDVIGHRVRTSILEQETVWRLTPDALEREQVLKDGKTVTVRYPYQDIREIRLSFAPTRVDRVRYRCDFQLRNGTLVAILSTHYAGFVDFEDRGATYGPLVRGLIERVAAANPACKFHAGKLPGAYWGEHIFLFLVIVLLVLVIGMVGGASLSTLVLIKLGILVFYIPVMILYTRKNWPRSFDPVAIPSALIPDSGKS